MKILHFDDDTDYTNILKVSFEQVGCDYKHYDRPPKNLVDVVLKEKPDVIVMDILMPEMDGVEATRIIKADPRTKSITIIGISNISEKEDIKRFKEAGMKDYFITSKIHIDELVERVLKSLKVSDNNKLMEENSPKQSNNSQSIGKEGWQAIFISAVVIAIVLWLFGFNFGQVSEGYVDSSDCRNTITLKKSSWGTYFGKFICDNGYCSKLVIKSGKCETEYYYIKEEK